MSLLKNLILGFTLGIGIGQSNATPHTLNILIIGGDSLYMIGSPLSNYFTNEISDDIFGRVDGFDCKNLACRFNHTSVWEIVNDKLCLKALVSCCDPEYRIEGNRLKEFKEIPLNSKWYSGTIWAGKSIYWAGSNGPYFESEYKIELSEGRLASITEYQYSDINVEAIDDPMSYLKEIYSLIEWQEIDSTELPEMVYVQGSVENLFVDENYAKFEVVGVSSENSEIVLEAFQKYNKWIRVYQEGKPLNTKLVIPIKLNSQVMEQYQTSSNR